MQFAMAALACRRRRLLLLLALLALVLAALVQEAAAAKDKAPPPPNKFRNGDGGGGGGGKKKRPPPPADAAESPRPPRSPKPSPRLSRPPAPEPASPPPEPSPPPPAPPSPPPPPPPYPALKLILKVTGASFLLDDAQQQAVIDAVNGFSQASRLYPYQFKAQTPSAPGIPPLNVVTTLRGTPGSPPPPVNTPSADDSTPWWPTDKPVLPANADGVYVFAESGAALSQVLTIQQNLNNAANSGALCTNLTDSGVSCTGTQIYFNNVGKVAFAPQNTTSTAAAGATSSSSDGLSIGAIVGIVVGSCAALAAVVISISIFVSCKRERTIERAAKLRTMQRRVDVPAQEESKWRQMYSARMQESMRRAEEAAERQKVAGSGPSFLEMQDRAFAEQAQQAATAERATPQRLGSKKSFGRGTPGTDVGASPSLQRDSPEHSLMSGSELSSPPPSVSSGKPGRSRSLKKLFGSKG